MVSKHYSVSIEAMLQALHEVDKKLNLKALDLPFCQVRQEYVTL